MWVETNITMLGCDNRNLSKEYGLVNYLGFSLYIMPTTCYLVIISNENNKVFLEDEYWYKNKACYYWYQVW